MPRESAASLALHSVGFIRDGRIILEDVELSVQPDERWLIMGANGSGKTTLIRIAALYEHPSSGTVSVLGETLGSTDVRSLRQRIGYMSASLAESLRPQLTALEVVVTAKNAALEPWWHQYETSDRDRAARCLERRGVGDLADQPFGTLSSGERQRVLLARTLMNDPGIVLLDEPSARLDLAGRELLVRALGELTQDPTAPPLVLVTHHVDEIPVGMTHVLALKHGRVLAQGPIEDLMSSDLMSRCFGIDVRLERRADGRYSAWSA